MMRIEYLADRGEFIQELAALHFREWGHLRPGQTLEARTERLRARCGHRQIPTVLVATSGAELLGSAMLLTRDMDTRKDLSPWLAGVYVKSAYRRQGIATRLVHRIEQEAATLGIRRLYLYAPTRVEAFYSRLAWQLMERCEYKGISVAVMHKPVDAQPANSADANSRAVD